MRLVCVSGWLLFFFAALVANAESCPREGPKGPNVESAVRTVRGEVVFHQGLRRWVELKPAQEVCGNTSVQLLEGGGGAFEADEGNSLAMERLRGCRVTVTGKVGIPATGYYSAPLYLGVLRVDPDKDCVRKPAIPTYWHAKPARGVRRYHVAMLVDYKGPGDVRAMIRSGNRTLVPWQAYANYWLTGEFAFYAHCAEGFALSGMRGTPEAKPWVIDNEISILRPQPEKGFGGCGWTITAGDEQVGCGKAVLCCDQ